MNLPTETIEAEQETPFFRCNVPVEHGKGVVQIGSRKFTVTVQETSIDGFTILVPPRHARKLKVGPSWVIQHDGARIEVQPQWLFNSPEGNVQLGLRRLRDLTKPPKVKSSFLNLGGSQDSSSSSIVVFGGFLLVLFCTLALPGLGEDLGTSDYISSAFHWVVSGIDFQVTRVVK